VKTTPITGAPKWIRRVGVVYGWFIIVGVLMYIAALFGIPAHPNGPPPLAGVLVNGFGAVFVLMPYRKLVHWRAGLWFCVAFLVFACSYSLFAFAQIAQSLQGKLPFGVVVFHVLMLSLFWSNCCLLFMWLKQARPRDADNLGVGAEHSSSDVHE
jgi:hypothetical protein